jgi:hypothetical protein
MKRSWYFCALATALVWPAAAQVATPAGGKASPAAHSGSSTVLVPSPDTLSPLLAQIQSAGRITTADISLLTIRRWKTTSDTRNDASTKAESIQRNLTVALPTIVSQVQNSPSDFAANFKLYRNLDVLYDVLASLTESVGAFGSRGEFDTLAGDLDRIDKVRRAVGERLEALASSKDAEIARLQTQLKTAKATAASAPPKKVIVDDDDKKPAKKTVAKKKPPAAATVTPASQPSNPQ